MPAILQILGGGKMEYTTEVIINLPREQVVELFDDPDNLPKWQDSLVSFEHLEGVPGEPGARSKLEYDEGRRRLTMIESILIRDLPERFHAKYETEGVVNISINRFEKLGPDKTRWIADNEFTFSGMMKLIGFFMRGSFPKETEKTMNQFKEFAEKSAGSESN